MKVTVTEEHTVSGQQTPENGNTHTGYVAIGDDGNTYHCQYPLFDGWSTDPYANWERYPFVPELHTSIVDEFLLWDATRLAWHQNNQQRFVSALNEKYPNELTLCSVEYRTGNVHGYYYTKDGCPACAIMKRWSSSA